MITPFRIDVPQADLDDLAERLARTRWPDALPGVGWDHGIPVDRVRELTDHWRTAYDWRRPEAELNRYPQLVTEIDGQRVHALHVRSTDPDALPLVLTHGWPGSIVEFLDVIAPLSEDFHLVIPSIPGFGFSGPTRERGWDVPRVARAWAELMRRLGYDRYGAQGGDWGSAISRTLGAVAPEHVVGVHLNYLPTPPPAAGEEDARLSESDLARLARTRLYLAHQPGVRVLNGTRPQVPAYGLSDSPVGQLAWLADTFAEWGDPGCTIDIDRLLTNVMLYWLTGTAGSAPRMHRESTAGPLPCPVPVGVAVFAHDVTLPVRVLAERLYRITRWTEFDRGGHFAALEVPDLFANDVRAFFRSLC